MSENKKGISLKNFFSISGMGVLVAFIALCVFLTIVSKNFMTAKNIMVIIRQSSWVGIMSIGMTMIIATGEIDLSVGSIIGFCSLLCAVFIQVHPMNIYLALILVLICGTLVGCFNGLLVAKMELASFIATLGTMQIFRGVVYVYTKGVPIFGMTYPEFQFWGQGYVGPIPFPIILLIILVAVFWVLLNRTKFGRHLVATGSNLQAANLVGIKTAKIKFLAYALTGFLCAISGILLCSRSEAAIVDAGSGYEMDAIAAVVIGGTSMTGGKLNLLGTILGAIMMTTIRNGLNQMNISSLWHQIVIGGVILLAVIFDKVTNTNKG